MLRRMMSLVCLLPALWVLNCGKIPTDPDSVGPLSDLSYINREWGFEVSRPSADWGLNVQTFELDRQINGLAHVEVRMPRPFTSDSGTSFRPEMLLHPTALDKDTTLAALISGYEQSLMSAFRGYRQIGEKEQFTLDNETAVQWQFRQSPFSGQNRSFPGTRFLAAVVVHRQEAYIMLGNGVRGDFPLQGYQVIIRSLKFIDR